MNVLVFGEILWDVFPQKKEIGGASLNFGAHLSKLGANVQLISAVGNDDLGLQSVEITKGFGISDKYISIIDKPTGVCNVSIDENGSPTYDLIQGVAYDHIPLDQDITDEYDAFYMGTLARRSEVSSNTFRKLMAEGKFKEVFCDLNIRQSYYSKKIIEESLRYATILKISRDDAVVFNELNIVEYSDLKELAKILAQTFNIKFVIITLDKDGAMLYSAEADMYYTSATPSVKVVSTVGAGDSFSACFLYNYLRGAAIRDCLNRAVILSAYVVTNLGAVPDYDEGLLEKII